MENRIRELRQTIQQRQTAATCALRNGDVSVAVSLQLDANGMKCRLAELTQQSLRDAHAALGLVRQLETVPAPGKAA